MAYDMPSHKLWRNIIDIGYILAVGQIGLATGSGGITRATCIQRVVFTK
jgi:hypothetical protein